MIQVVEWACEQQQWFFEAGPQPTLLVGGFDSAKTYGGILKLLYLLHRYPKSRAAIIRATSTQARKTTSQTFFQLCPEASYSAGRRNDQEGFVILNNGSRIDFIHLDKPNSMRVLRGLEVNFALVDQAEELSEEAWDILDARVGRWSGFEVTEELLDPDWPHRNDNGDPIPPRYLFATANPSDETHWLYLRFAEDSPERGYWDERGYQCKTVSSFDNKFGSRELRKVYEQKDDDFKRRFVYGLWGNPEGTIFRISEMSIIDPDVNMGLIDKIIHTMRLHRSLDHGETAPTCCGWHGTDPEGNIFTYREYYADDLLVSDHRQAIFERSKADADRSILVVPNYHSNLADPSIFAKSRGRTVNSGPRWSVADEYTDTKVMPKETVIRWAPADNGEEVTRSRLKEYLRVDPTHKHPITGELGSPRLFFIKKTRDYPNGCDRVIKEIRAQKKLVKETVGGRKVFSDERDPTIVDHAYDMEKYFVVSRPSPGVAVALPAPPPGQMRLDDYNRMAQEVTFRRRREERRQGVEGSY